MLERTLVRQGLPGASMANSKSIEIRSVRIFAKGALNVCQAHLRQPEAALGLGFTGRLSAVVMRRFCKGVDGAHAYDFYV